MTQQAQKAQSYRRMVNRINKVITGLQRVGIAFGPMQLMSATWSHPVRAGSPAPATRRAIAASTSGLTGRAGSRSTSPPIRRIVA